MHIALGTYANKHGRVAGINIGRRRRRRRRAVLGTAITKLCALEIALHRAQPRRRPRDAGFDAVATTIDTTTLAGYLPRPPG